MTGPSGVGRARPRKPTQQAKHFVAQIAQFNEWVGDAIRHGVMRDERAFDEVTQALWRLGRARRRLLYGNVNAREVA